MFIVVGLNAFQQIVSPEVFTSFYFSVPKLSRQNFGVSMTQKNFLSSSSNSVAKVANVGRNEE